MKTPLSFSRIEEFKRCAFRYFMRYVLHHPDFATIPSETGLGFHAWAEEVGEAFRRFTEVDELFLLQVLARKAALCEDEVARDLRRIVTRYLNAGGPPRIPSDAVEVELEKRVALTFDGELVGWDDPRADFRGILDQTWLENAGELAVVRDWKTRRVISEPGEQLRQYGWAAAVAHPSVVQVSVELHFVRFGRTFRRAILEADELRASVPVELRAVAEKIGECEASKRWPARVSDACRTCPVVRACPKASKTPRGFKRIESLAEAREAADELELLKALAKDTEAALRAWVLRYGGIPLDGEVLDFVPKEVREVPDAWRAYEELLRLGMGEADARKALSMGKGDLERAFKVMTKDAPRGTRQERQREMLAAFEAAGLVQAKTRSEFRRKAAGEEEEEVSDED